MSHHLNAGAKNGRRASDIPTTALVALTALIAVPLFGYVHGYTRLDWAMGGISISSADWASPWGTTG
jgi:hypothetical protein